MEAYLHTLGNTLGKCWEGGGLFTHPGQNPEQVLGRWGLIYTPWATPWTSAGKVGAYLHTLGNTLDKCWEGGSLFTHPGQHPGQVLGRWRLIYTPWATPWTSAGKVGSYLHTLGNTLDKCWEGGGLFTHPGQHPGQVLGRWGLIYTPWATPWTSAGKVGAYLHTLGKTLSKCWEGGGLFTHPGQHPGQVLGRWGLIYTPWATPWTSAGKVGDYLHTLGNTLDKCWEGGGLFTHPGQHPEQVLGRWRLIYTPWATP